MALSATRAVTISVAASTRRYARPAAVPARLPAYWASRPATVAESEAALRRSIAAASKIIWLPVTCTL